MSRDAVGDLRRPPVPGSAGPGRPDDLDDDRDHHDVDLDPRGREEGAGTPTLAAVGRRRLRGALALLVAALVGAAGALVVVRAGDDGPPPLTLLLAWGSGSPAGDDVVVDLVVANSGREELVLLAGGTGGPADRLEGELRPSGLGLPRRGTTPAEGSEVVVPALGSAALGLRLPVSCTDPPPWRPWVEVRTPSTATQVVDLAVVDDLLGSGEDAIVDACTSSSPLLLTPSVVDQRTDDAGLVLQVRNDTDVPYGVEVVDGGAAGVSLADEDVRLLASSTTDVALRVDPEDCDAALAVPDLLADVAVSAVRLEDGEGPARTTLVLDPFVAGAQVGIGVGRACAGAAATAAPGAGSDDGAEVRRGP